MQLVNPHVSVVGHIAETAADDLWTTVRHPDVNGATLTLERRIRPIQDWLRLQRKSDPSNQLMWQKNTQIALYKIRTKKN